MEYNNESRNEDNTYRGINRGRRGNRGYRAGFRGRGRGRGRGGIQNQENNVNRGGRPRGRYKNYRGWREAKNVNDEKGGSEKSNEDYRGRGRGRARGRWRGRYRGNYGGGRETEQTNSEKEQSEQSKEDFRRTGRRGKRGRGHYRGREDRRGKFPGFRGRAKNSQNIEYYLEYLNNQEEDQKKSIIQQENEFIEFSKKNSINSFQNFKFNKELLDEYQLNAFELCLKNKLCLIQGPPGTGKTYLSTIIANLFLRNIMNSSLILIISSSEKTLAQLINNILQYRDNINRISQDIKNKNIFDIIDSTYLNILHELIYLGKQKKILTDLINEQRPKITVVDSQLLKRLSNDFYYIAQNSIDKKIILERNDKLEIDIFNFWIKIGNKDNDPTEIIFKLLGSKINDEERINLFQKIYNNLKIFLKHSINNIDDLNEYEDNNNNINLIENQNEKSKIENEDSEESDEIIEKNENLNNIKDDKIKLEEKIKCEYSNNKILEEEDPLDKISNIIIEPMSLNRKKYESLMTSQKINYFKFGPKIIKLIIDYMKNIILLDHIKRRENLKIICLTKELFNNYYYKGLNKYNFQSVIIEEAEDISDFSMLYLLSKLTKQIMLFGDSRKLNQKQENDNKNVSFLKKLINNNNIHIAKLKYQRRMKPLFIEFVKLIYGENSDNIYINHSDINNKEKIKGVEKDMFIIEHNQLEEVNDNLDNITNSYEAKYLIKLFQYLLKQGYREEQITILSFYESQITLFKRYTQIIGESKEIKIKTIDNYLGEENDIILLSLVRSNKTFEIGILNSIDKIYMAFSRAKIGFYIIGNIDCIIKGENILLEKEKPNSTQNANEQKIIGIWERIKKKALELNIIGNKLILECQNHKTKTNICDYKDFKKCPEGGCMEKCKKRMNCGHVCQQFCHISDCNEKKCFKEITEKNPYCKLKIHECTKKCYEDFGRCRVKVEKKLPCGHIEKIKCYKEIKKIKCHANCSKKLPCGHIKNDCICYKDYNESDCKEKCNKILKCGHKCTGLCNQCLSGTLHVKCSVKCGKILPCGHFCNQKCSSECFCEENCPNNCPHSKCPKKCCEICIDCREECVIGCKHEQCKKSCGELCSREPCNKRCENIMKCGHQCYGLCGEMCPEKCRICTPDDDCFKKDFFYFDELNEDALIYKTKCGHIFEVSGLDNYIKSIKNIQLYTCPQCKCRLIWEPRYQNLIRNIFIDIQKIKALSLDRNLGKDDNTFFLKSNEIVKRILSETFRKKEKTDIFLDNKLIEQKINIFEILPKSMYSNQRLLEYEHYDLEKKLPIIYNLCKNEFKGEKDINSRKCTTYNLLTLAEKFMGIEYYIYVMKKEKSEKKELKFSNYFNVIKTYFQTFEEPFNNFFFIDLKEKIDNMLYYSILKLDKKGNIKNNLYNLKTQLIPPEVIEKNNFSLKINLKDIYKTNYVDKEVLNLLKSLGTKWYRCPNGHLYTVGECGRPMEESSCPQCKEKIGGKNHIPASGNLEINLDNEIKSNKNKPINNKNNNSINNHINNQNINNYNNNHINNYNNNTNNNHYEEDHNYNLNKKQSKDCNLI